MANKTIDKIKSVFNRIRIIKILKYIDGYTETEPN